jgi:hypothetical protein
MKKKTQWDLIINLKVKHGGPHMKEGVSGAKPSCYGKTKKLSCSSSKRTSVSVSFPLSPHQQQRANYSSLHNPSATDYINKKKVF